MSYTEEQIKAAGYGPNDEFLYEDEQGNLLPNRTQNPSPASTEPSVELSQPVPGVDDSERAKAQMAPISKDFGKTMKQLESDSEKMRQELGVLMERLEEVETSAENDISNSTLSAVNDIFQKLPPGCKTQLLRTYGVRNPYQLGQRILFY